MEGIQLSVEKAGIAKGISIIKVGGYIDTTTSAELEHALDTLIKAGSYNIIIDLGNVDYVSSAGWGIFISEIKGIREHGGDLKLVRMIPEVYEVFELLEFHYILKAFDTLEEAIRDFGKIGGIPMPTTYDDSGVTIEEVNTAKTERQQGQSGALVTGTTGFADLTITNKLKKIVSENPTIGLIGICRELNTPKYGNEKLGWFRTRSLLKEMNLETKKKRVQYFHSTYARNS